MPVPLVEFLDHQLFAFVLSVNFPVIHFDVLAVRTVAGVQNLTTSFEGLICDQLNGHDERHPVFVGSIHGFLTRYLCLKAAMHA